MTIHFYLKTSVPVHNRMVSSGKNQSLKNYASLGQAEVEIGHDSRGFYLHSGEFYHGRGPCDGSISVELTKATEYLTYSNTLPDNCLREIGVYSLTDASAEVTENTLQGGRKYNSVFVTAPNFESLKKLWQALLDGSIRPERPLFNKQQQGLSYSELTAAVAELTPQLRQAMVKLGDAESTLIHLRAVVRSCSDVLQGQMRDIADLQGLIAVANVQRDMATQQLLDFRAAIAE